MKTATQVSMERLEVEQLKNQLIHACNFRFQEGFNPSITDVFRMAPPDVRIVWLASNQGALVKLMESIEMS